MSRGFIQAFIVKLLIAIIAVVFVIILGMRLLSGFINDPDDTMAIRSIRVLAQRIEVAQNTKESAFNTVLALPKGSTLVTFAPGQKEFSYEYSQTMAAGHAAATSMKQITIPRPDSCDGACICIFRNDVTLVRGSSTTRPLIACRNIDVKGISGAIEVPVDVPKSNGIVLRVTMADTIAIVPSAYGIRNGKWT